MKSTNIYLRHARLVCYRVAVLGTLCLTCAAVYAVEDKQPFERQDDAIRDYVNKGLALYEASALVAGEQKLRLIQKHPHVSKVFIKGGRDSRLDGVIIAYLSLLGDITKTKFSFASTGHLGDGFLFIFDDSARSWTDLASLIKGLPGSEFFRTTYESAVNRNIELHDCEYVPIYDGRYIAGGIIYFRPGRGIGPGNDCLYKGIFAMFGFSTGKNGTGSAIDIEIIGALYGLDQESLNVNSVSGVLFDRIVR